MDKALACKKVERLIDYYEELRDFPRVPYEEYEGDILLRRAVERQISLIIGCVLYINSVLLDDQENFQYVFSENHIRSFANLAKKGILDTDTALKMVPLVKLYSMIQYQYENIKFKMIYTSVQKILDDLLPYIESVMDYLRWD